MHELSQRIYSLRSVPETQATERILPGTTYVATVCHVTIEPAVLPQTAASINMKLLKIQPRTETGVTPFCSPDSSDISLGKEFLLCQNNCTIFTSWGCREDSTSTSANMVCSPPDLSWFHKMTVLSRLRRLVAVLSPRIPWIDPGPLYLVLMLNKWE